jgi:rhodanese-related sulfurtransferase
MSAVTEISATSQTLLDSARAQARLGGLLYAGDIAPHDAWQLFSQQEALLIDVRTAEEREAVGYVPDSVHVAWATGNPLVKNPHFVRELERHAHKLDVILLLCRSGRRSVAAADTISRLGFKNVFNITEGFEGEQGQGNGWLARKLPRNND